MNMFSPLHEFVGVGLYDVGEVARLIKAPPRTIRRWMMGYDYVEDGECHHVEPLWQPDLHSINGTTELSFRDLMELRFVRAFVNAGIGLKAVRACLAQARECIDSDRPFSTGRFRTDGRTIFLQSLNDSDDPKLLDLRRKQFVFGDVVAQTFKDLDVEDDTVTRWRPYHGKGSIVVDPARAFGQPIAAASGVPTIVLSDAVKVEESLARVAALYEVDRAVVQDAVRFHEELAST
ncbi:hypothetical protein L2U69_12915 [Zavarzinia compransoris]|uniref:hypothetical protein n=1 Tax=Zavarzinia marina TaxID=2911065 RepID=UPI001F1E7242|nr:hypothetical protein [Zavarzinia marina]MCF4166548.1 hypothetical protein [Zavarzinia marina]